MKFIFPGHNYLGPGNELESGKPVDRDDLIAKKHDYLYHYAQTDSDILNADVLAVDAFWKDFKENTKKVDVQHRGHKLYGDRQKSLSEAYRNRPDKADNWPAFQKRWYQEGRHRPDAGVSTDRPNDAGSDNTTDNDNEVSGNAINKAAGGSSEESDIVLRPSKRPRVNSSSPSSDNFDFADWFLDENNMDIPMDTAIPPLPVGGLGQNSLSSGAGRSTQETNNVSFLIPKSIVPRPEVFKFSKTRLAYSYGYSCEKIKTTTKFVKLTTSLSLIPVDCVAFYLTPQEFNDLPISAKVNEVRCSVKILGLRTAFDTGSTAAGSANTEHVAIGWFGVGLNLHTQIENQKYTAAADSPMKPSDAEDASIQDMVKKYYEDDAPHSIGIPRSLSIYLCIFTAATDNDVPHNSGWQQLDRLVQRYNVAAAIGKKIIEYTYKPTRGELKGKKYEGQLSKTVDLYAEGVHDLLTLQKWQINCAKDGKVVIAKKHDYTDQVNYIGGPSEYESYVEKCFHRKVNTRPNDWNKQQPQIHVGLQAIPQLNPATEMTNFQNSSLYYEITCEMDVSIDFASTYVKGPMHYSPSNVIFQGGKHTY